MTTLSRSVRLGVESLRRPALPRTILAAALGSVALAVASHVAVPFWPVPITATTLVVMLLGAFAGPAVAGGAVLAYLGEGLAGLPVFAGGGGAAYMVGPTGGYLLGYLLAAVLIGTAAQRGWMRGIASTAAVLLAGEVALFALGVGWLAVLVGPERAVAGGLVPFLLGDLLKVALVTALVQVRSDRPTQD